MLISTTGVVYAAEGSVVLDVVPPPRTLAEAMAARGHDEGREFNEILFETGVNRGPVEVQIEVLPAEPAEDTTVEWEEAWEDFDFELPLGTVNLYGPTMGDVLNIGTIEEPSVYRFRIQANGRSRMRDLVATEAVESYLVQVWIVEQQTGKNVP
ncbi:hypothetical protein [Pseudarthrobacter sp. BIM B-2242]|uniref:hypothetical protein n=1 Tax=Pseudarthrobacter sp. BIM B-2242 TaxID=2772401 RepID=UPI00168B57E4|nr:hypothetical protein [Pseudarthrobacter sp. BIM B-2242]QOD03206.1 hypothetical protein IDT60_18180 [Pseudarthrobacter sp. BIM B-2242]